MCFSFKFNKERVLERISGNSFGPQEQHHIRDFAESKDDD